MWNPTLRLPLRAGSLAKDAKDGAPENQAGTFPLHSSYLKMSGRHNMYCNACGKVITEGDRVCSGCGKTVGVFVRDEETDAVPQREKDCGSLRRAGSLLRSRRNPGAHRLPLYHTRVGGVSGHHHLFARLDHRSLGAGGEVNGRGTTDGDRLGRTAGGASLLRG